ncbi:MAG: (Fe-S)-binding protein, partial [Clostridia bacterium]
VGLSWASSGGESSALLNDRYLAADGIENVIKVLDEIETGSYPYLDFIELNACNGGCVGGALAVENPYIARVRLQNIRRYLPVQQNHLPKSENTIDFPDDLKIVLPEYSPVSALNSDKKTAMRLMSDVNKVFESLPELDCGSCGAPTCKAFAEDVVRGNASMDECIVVMRDMLKKLYN